VLGCQSYGSLSVAVLFTNRPASARIAAPLSVERGASMKAQMSCKLTMWGYLVKVCTQNGEKAVRADRRFKHFYSQK